MLLQSYFKRLRTVKIMTLVLKVSKKNGEDAKTDLIAKNYFNGLYKPDSDKNHIYFPVTSEFKTKLGTFENRNLSKFKSKPASLRELFMKVLPIKLVDDVRRSYDLIGDIAIIEIPDSLKKYEKVIANSLLKTNSKIKVVAKKPSKIDGKYRIRKLKILAGEKRTTTKYKESDCLFEFDLNKTYFSQRLSNERLRLANKVKGSEKILVMFSGIAPFGIIIAKKHPFAKVLNIELNPNAVTYAKKNIELNHLESRVFSIKGDVKIEIPKLKEKFDRIIMVLPHDNEKFLSDALKVTKNGTKIHMYTIQEESNINKFKKEICSNHPIRIVNTVKAGDYGPKMWRYCLDMKVIE